MRQNGEAHRPTIWTAIGADLSLATADPAETLEPPAAVEPNRQTGGTYLLRHSATALGDQTHSQESNVSRWAHLAWLQGEPSKEEVCNLRYQKGARGDSGAGPPALPVQSQEPQAWLAGHRTIQAPGPTLLYPRPRGVIQRMRAAGDAGSAQWRLGRRQQ